MPQFGCQPLHDLPPRHLPLSRKRRATPPFASASARCFVTSAAAVAPPSRKAAQKRQLHLHWHEAPSASASGPGALSGRGDRLRGLERPREAAAAPTTAGSSGPVGAGRRRAGQGAAGPERGRGEGVPEYRARLEAGQGCVFYSMAVGVVRSGSVQGHEMNLLTS